MTPEELELYLSLTQEIKRLEALLETAVKTKQALAKTLYERHGKGTSYKVGDDYLIISPTKQGTYYFAQRIRWPKEARAAKREKKRLDRIARMQRPPLASEAADPSTFAEPVQEPPAPAEEALPRVDEPSQPAEPPPAEQPSPRQIEITATLTGKSRTQDGGEDVPSASDPAPEVTTHPPPEPAPSQMPDSTNRRLPLVGDVDQPTQIEPRLLQIQEPLESDPDEPESQIQELREPDPDEPESDSSGDDPLKELLRDLDDK